MNSAPSLVSEAGIVSNCLYQWEGIVQHGWDQCKNWCLINGVIGGMEI
ncbi:unnamed protein product [Staurois parvus]|uniref:Uncharacterized protein n=1 Tax=Staurois parvus TaxID=386267 RepID=A0ABN9HEE6_9NEOB|nr:unnamed protein product [Staurois parvus]